MTRSLYLRVGLVGIWVILFGHGVLLAKPADAVYPGREWLRKTPLDVEMDAGDLQRLVRSRLRA